MKKRKKEETDDIFLQACKLAPFQEVVMRVYIRADLEIKTLAKNIRKLFHPKKNLCPMPKEKKLQRIPIYQMNSREEGLFVLCANKDKYAVGEMPDWPYYLQVENLPVPLCNGQETILWSILRSRESDLREQGYEVMALRFPKSSWGSPMAFSE